MNIINDMLVAMNSGSLNDSAPIKGSDDASVHIKPVVDDKQRKDELDEILIETGESDIPEIGNNVTIKGKGVEDGVYSYENDEGEEVNFVVESGKIKAIGDEAIEDLTKLSIVGGKKVKKNIPTVKRRMSAKQKQALAKARKKAASPAAVRARVKSFKKGAAMGLHSSEDVNNIKLDISTVDLNGLGDSLYEEVFEALCDRYELTGEAIDSLDESLVQDDICNPVVDGEELKFLVPVWTEVNDEVELENYDIAELSYDLKGKFDSASLLEVLTDGEIKMQSSLIV